jgi:hypothetical protein
LTIEFYGKGLRKWEALMIMEYECKWHNVALSSDFPLLPLGYKVISLKVSQYRHLSQNQLVKTFFLLAIPPRNGVRSSVLTSCP